MHGCLFRAGRAAVDADIAREKVLLLVGMRTLIRCDQPAGPGIGLVISEAVVVLVVLGLRVGVRLRLLLRPQLVEPLAARLLRQRRAEPLPGRPAAWSA